jgi:hypothetical protein
MIKKAVPSASQPMMTSGPPEKLLSNQWRKRSSLVGLSDMGASKKVISSKNSGGVRILSRCGCAPFGYAV